MKKLVDYLERISMGLAMLCVIAVMLIVSYDAIARYAIGRPLPWTYDVVSHFLLTGSIFFAASSTFKAGDHINIDLFRPMIPPAARVRLDGLWCLLSALAIGLMTYCTAAAALKALSRGQFFTGYVMWPAWIPYALIAFGCAVFTLRLIVDALPALLLGRDSVAIPNHEDLPE